MRNLMRRRSVKTVVLGVIAGLTVSLLSGCKSTEALPAGGSGKKEYGKAETMMIVTTERLRYEELYSDKIWNTAVDNRGTTFETVMMVQMREFMKELRIISAMAEEQDVKLSSQEKELVKEAAGRYMKELGAEGEAALEVSESQAEQFYTDYWRAEKLVETLTGGMNLEVSDSEAKVVTVNEIVFSDAAKAQEALLKVRAEGADFAAIAKEYSEATEIKKRVTRGTRGAEYEAAAYSLVTGEVSDVITDGETYYILKCISDYDESATRAHKEEMMLQRKNAAFYSIYEEYKSQVKLTGDDELWNSLSISESPKVNADFFEIFEEVCKGKKE